MLLIDDDPLFRAKAEKMARKRNIAITTCASLHEMQNMAVPKLFDVAVIDYYLDGLKDRLKGTDVAYGFQETPVILVSNSDQCVHSYESWPNSVRKFVNKKTGLEAIFDSAMRMVKAPEAIENGFTD